MKVDVCLEGFKISAGQNHLLLSAMPRKCRESIKVKFLAFLDYGLYGNESSDLCDHLQNPLFNRL
jgi:hypothetical protein